MSTDEYRAEMEAAGWTVEEVGTGRNRVVRACRNGQKVAVEAKKAYGESTLPPLERAYVQLRAAVLDWRRGEYGE